MAEFLVDKLLNALADSVIAKLQEEFKLVTGVRNEVKNLSTKLKIIKSMLQDVQRRKLKEDLVGIWLEKLEDVAYDVDDVLDEWNTEVQKLKLKAEEDPNSLSPQLQTKRNKVCSFLLSICSCFKQVSVRRDIAQKIRELNVRMNNVFQEADEFKFDLTNLSSTSENFKRVISTSVFNESEVYAREYAKHEIASKLLSDAKDGICIVSIVGMGGIGKTTLAQLVYNDNQMKDHFDLKKWICVSDPFDQKRIAKAILEESSLDMFELEALLQRVKESISGKKFLFVLDDVWTEDYNTWKPIWNSLKDGAPGSRILVTTRSERVAKMMGTNHMHQLGKLSDLDCWKILSRIAFQGRPESECEKFAGLGMEISKKCKGLPLAANFLGCLLQFKDKVEQWRNVLESEIWELEEAATSLFPHIYLSYNELSPEQKRCFLYCAVFPKDSDIGVTDLIRQWMAQGYLSSSSSVGKRDENLELRGYDCFCSLAARSFFQNFERDYYGEIRSCKMHDIVHDFAQHLTNGECLIIENLDEAKKLSWEKVRHLTWSCQGDVAVDSINVSNVGKLRSFYNGNWNTIVPVEISGGLKCVRALSLRGMHLEELPKSIGNLIHLRFLDLSYNYLTILPDEICELYNLETLDVEGCTHLTQFPERIENLRNLRHLDNQGTHSLKQFPRGLEKLTSLQTLSEFKVGNEYSKLEYLQNLNQLGGEVQIDFYEVYEIDFESVNLGDKIHLIALWLDFMNSNNNGVSIKGEQAQTPPKLQRLILQSYPKTKLPSWIMSLDNVVELGICYGQVTSLPALGKLPSLEKLIIEGVKGLEFLGREFLGITEINASGVVVAFPKLKTLSFEDLCNLRMWEEDENSIACELKIMPCLEKLEIITCKKLEMLPHGILRRAKSLKHLVLRDCPALTERYDFKASATATDWNHISHISRITIDGRELKSPD